MITTNQYNYEEIFKNAKEAKKTIAQFSLGERLEMIKTFKKYIEKNHQNIVQKVQDETNKSRSDAFIGEIFGTMEHLDFLIKNGEKALRDKKVHTPIAMLGKKSLITYSPLGVTLIIAPWNYPFYQAIVPITSSFLAGNATIYKPSELTPLKGLIEQITQDAFKGAKNWCQVIYGDGSVGKELIVRKPNKIFFTGSAQTGKKILQQASQNLIPVELELGGKDAMILCSDANIYRASKAALWGAFTNCGQSCTSTENLFIHESIYSKVKDNLLNAVNKITQGIDKDGSTDIGEMTSLEQVEVVATQLKDALDKGAIQLSGHDWDYKTQKIPPIILENTNDSMLVHHHETFGPILPIHKFELVNSVINFINNQKFGLSASVWSKDKQNALKIAKQLEVGNVSINNVMLTEGNHALPFGGVKESGFGRAKGIEGLHGFCNIKSLIIDGGHNKTDPNWYPYTQKKYQLFKKMTFNLFDYSIKGFLKFAIHGLKLEFLSNRLGKKISKK